ncbi:MAG: PsiF family protein [Rudaea sp.]
MKGGSAAAPAAPVTTSKATAQQERMKTCNAEAKAKALKGAARKSFMSSCLKGESHASAAPAASAKSGKTAQQEKMKSCNAEAKSKSLKGAARKSFMSTCLKGEATPASR